MHLLIACTGNTCRSPMAEALARRLAEARGLSPLTVSSAGTSAWDGAPASDGALLVGLENGLDLNGHRARQLDQRMVAEADLILVMGPHHLERALVLGGEGKSFLLSDYAHRTTEGRAIADPFGGGLDLYRATFQELERALGLVMERLATDPSASQG